MRLFTPTLVFVLLLACWVNAAYGQFSAVGISGIVRDQRTKAALPYVYVVLRTAHDSSLVTGVMSDEQGRFFFTNVKPNTYLMTASFAGYSSQWLSLYVGALSEFLEAPTIELRERPQELKSVLVQAKADAVNNKMDRKTFSVDENISQKGGSVLQAMQNLPGITVQDGKVHLRGSDQITVLIDGKQTALTGMGSQTGLDNLPASAIEKIEIINNPSVKHDANGNAGIINIIYRKTNRDGLHGKAGLTGGLGALWLRQENLPGIRPQYERTPKVNPSLSLNYRKGVWDLFFQGDYLYTETLNKNEFVTRTYDNGTVIQQQTKRNRNTHFVTTKVGADYRLDERNLLTLSALYGIEKIIDRGDEPFFNQDFSARLRLWQFLEDELKTTFMAATAFQHKYKRQGQMLNVGLNYTFHREDEKYFFDNILPTYVGKDAFKLISDEQVIDLNMDYVRPLMLGRIEGGLKFRQRNIPTNMQFIPGLNSPLDANAGGPATYSETIPALYANYVLENQTMEAEVGLRLEYVNINYEVGPDHPVYHSDGYHYAQPFPNIRLAYKLNEHNRITLFYNRRVDRPNEVDIRIFPKYDDAEIIKVGNPALRPQFTNTLELGYKMNWKGGYYYAAAYYKHAEGTITRMASTAGSSPLIYSVFQNAKDSRQSGVEMLCAHRLAPWCTMNVNLNGYVNIIDAFSVVNQYPVETLVSAERQQTTSGSAKLNALFKLQQELNLQTTFLYLAPDIVPQGRVAARFSIDIGLKKSVQAGKGEWFINATDLANTLVTRRDIQGNGFSYRSMDFSETQVVRLGYSYKF